MSQTNDIVASLADPQRVGQRTSSPGENRSEGLVTAGKCSNSAVYPALDKGVPVEGGSLDPYLWIFGNCSNCRRRGLGGDVDLNIAAAVGVNNELEGKMKGEECDASHFWEHRRVARCGLSASGQPDTAMTKGKARGLDSHLPRRSCFDVAHRASGFGCVGSGISRREFRNCDLSISA